MLIFGLLSLSFAISDKAIEQMKAHSYLTDDDSKVAAGDEVCIQMEDSPRF